MTRRQIEIEIESHYDSIADLQKQLARIDQKKRKRQRRARAR
jgi:hypothetical protein